MTKLSDALDLVESGQSTDRTLATLPALSEALSALCMEDIANTLRVIAYGPAEHEYDSAEHSDTSARN